MSSLDRVGNLEVSMFQVKTMINVIAYMVDNYGTKGGLVPHDICSNSINYKENIYKHSRVLDNSLKNPFVMADEVLKVMIEEKSAYILENDNYIATHKSEIELVAFKESLSDMIKDHATYDDIPDENL